MTRKAKKNLAIIAQIFLLCGLIFWIGALGRQDQQALLDRIVLPEDEAAFIIIERTASQLEFRREIDGWHMSKPEDAVANEQRIMPILSLLTLPGSHRYHLSDVDEVKLGLTPAQATVRINQISFAFGYADSTGQRRYLKTGKSVYLIDDLIYPLINSAADTFIAPAVTD